MTGQTGEFVTRHRDDKGRCALCWAVWPCAVGRANEVRKQRTDAVDNAALAWEYARKVEAGTATAVEVSTLVCHLSTLCEDLPALLGVVSSPFYGPRLSGSVVEEEDTS